ncbi:fungal lectin Cgl3 in complex with Chitotriose [Cristinia sonorae]|uniref:Galectin n=1 Tax=Cristinia sonorae TaxID=1940300 RepID=A0A8K0XJY0_9AGAR|nr:fungal lectin Cgl3 in complex with Chitotriose [Cristinia sonorae]
MVALSIGKTVTLTPNLAPNSKATIESDTLTLAPDNSTTIDNTALNFLNNLGDVLLHFSIRRQEDTIVLNSRTAAGSWGNEERFPSLTRAFGPTYDKATVIIKDTGKEYQIFTNGNYLGTYKKRIGGEVEQASYTINSGQDSAFSNPVKISVN